MEVKFMRKYETIFVLRPDLEEDDIEKSISRIKDVITNSESEIIEEEIWGKKSLAYEINDYRSGHYTVLTFKSDGSVIDELKRNYKIMDSVIRHLVVKKEN